MKHLLVVFMTFFAISMVSLNASAKDDESGYNYELENAKVSSGQTGYVTLKVWSYGRREKVTRDICMRNAVHGVIFKGLDANGTGTTGQLPALCPEGYEAHASYFDGFFKSDYMQFVQISSKGGMSPGDVIQISKKEYKIGMLVKVNMKALRARLEADGVCKGVKSIFSR